MKLKTTLLLKFMKENWWIKSLVNILLLLTIFYKSLIVLSVTSGSTSIISFATVISSPVEITSVSLSFAFSKTAGIMKKVLKTTQKKKK